MAKLPSTFPGYIQIEETRFKAGVSEYLAQKIGRIANFLADKDLTIETITSSGTWTKPSTVKTVFVFGAGGGGGGGSGGQLASCGGCGGAGGLYGMYFFDVSAVASVAIAIGAGGAGGVASAGANGGDTTFGSFITFHGGAGGGKGDRTNDIAANPYLQANPAVASHEVRYNLSNTNWGGWGARNTTPLSAINGVTSLYAAGGVAGAGGGAGQGAGGGGGASFGAGANGGGVSSAGSSASANTGGGGGGGGADSITEYNGGNGGSGIIYLAYLNS